MALQFIGMEALENMQEPEWLIDGMLPMGASAILFGQEQSYKSFITLDMMYSVVFGTDFHGFGTKQVKGLYVASEGGPAIKKRWLAWKQDRGVTTSANMDYIMDESIMLDKPDAVEAYAHELKNRGYQFIIFDTLRTSVSGDSSEGDKTFGAVTRSMRTLARICNATVLVVHHTTKTDKDTYAGWNSLATNSTTVMKVVRSGDTSTLSCTKQKDSEPFEPIKFIPKSVGDSLVMVRSGSEPQPDREPTVEERIIKYIEDHSPIELTSEAAVIRDDLCINKDSFDSAVRRSKMLSRPKQGWVAFMRAGC